MKTYIAFLVKLALFLELLDQPLTQGIGKLVNSLD